MRHPQTNGFKKRFHLTVLNEFLAVKFRERFYASAAALQVDLDEWLRFYNCERPHLGCRNDGRRPIDTVLSFVDQVPQLLVGVTTVAPVMTHKSCVGSF